MNQSEKIYRNVKALCKLNHEYMRDIEKMAGLSNGYLARTVKNGISLYHANIIAQHFGVTIDDLMNKEFYSGVDQDDIPGIMSAIEKALEGTGYAAVGWENTELWLEVLVERRVTHG